VTYQAGLDDVILVENGGYGHQGKVQENNIDAEIRENAMKILHKQQDEPAVSADAVAVIISEVNPVVINTPFIQEAPKIR